MGVAGACAEQAANSGPQPLSVSTPVDVNPVGVPPQTSSNAGEIASTVTVSGGTAPYAFAWKLQELSDPDGVLSPNQGSTVTSQTYDDATVTASHSPGQMAAPGTYEVECQVTDSATPPAVVTVTGNAFDVIPLPF